MYVCIMYLLVPYFAARFLRMAESGLFNRWRTKHWPPPSNCSTGTIFTEVTTKPLMLEDIVSSLLLYLLGTLLALLAFLLERLLSAARDRPMPQGPEETKGRRWALSQKHRWH